MKEVFCGDCRHVKESSDCFGGVYYACKKDSHYQSNPIHEGFSYGICEELNKDKNCKNYDAKVWKRITSWFKEKK